MYKFTIGGAVAAIAFALPVLASAATVSGTAIFSGQTNLYGNAGQTVQVSTNFNVNGGEVLHAVQTDIIGDNLPPVCHIVNVVEGMQTNVSVSFSETLSPNAGDYGYTMNAYTAATVPQANALNQSQGTACTGSNTSVYNQGSVVHVLPNGSGSTGGSGSSVETWKAQFCAAFPSFPGCGTATVPAPTPVNTMCTQLQAKQVGTSYGVYNDANVSMQGFLLSWNANSIPALKAGSTVPMGFFGSQTATAVSNFKTANGCI